jgi:hypothetical protein
MLESELASRKQHDYELVEELREDEERLCAEETELRRLQGTSMRHLADSDSIPDGYSYLF